MLNVIFFAIFLQRIIAKEELLIVKPLKPLCASVEIQESVSGALTKVN